MPTVIRSYVRSLGLDAYVVGGAVRDQFLGREQRNGEEDFIVPGVDQAGLRALLEPHGRVEDMEVHGQLVGVRLHPRDRAVRALVRRLMSHSAEIEDVVHDVFCKLPWVIGQCRSGLGGWLKQVTISTALMHLRKTRLRREEGLVENCDVSRRAVDEITLLSLDHADELRRALAQLSKPLRRVVHLRFYLGYSHQQIATTLGISPNASEVRLCRALKQLRQTIRSDSVRVRGMAAVKRTAPSASLIGARAS